MSSKFLDTGGTDLSALTDGTFNLNVATATVIALAPSLPVKSNAARQLASGLIGLTDCSFTPLTNPATADLSLGTHSITNGVNISLSGSVIGSVKTTAANEIVSNAGAGTAGRVAVFSGATGKLIADSSTPDIGTPTGTLTSCVGLPVATGISGLGSGVSTFLATPSSANLLSAMTTSTGTGNLVFANAPTFAGTVNMGGNTLSNTGNVTFTGALSGFSSYVSIATSEGNFMNFGGGGRDLAVDSSGNLYLSYGADYTTSGHSFVAPNSPSTFISIGSTGGHLQYAPAPGLGGGPVTPTDALAWSTTGALTAGGSLAMGTNAISGVTNLSASGSLIGTSKTTALNEIVSNSGSSTDGHVAVFSGTTGKLLTDSGTPNLGTPSAATLTNCTGLPIASGVSGLGSGVATFLATPSSANLLSALTTSTGTGNNVFATSPVLVTPTLGAASATSLSFTGSALSGLSSVIAIDSSFADGNYIGLGGGGRNMGVLSTGDLFLSTNANYNATSNVYKYDGTSSCIFVELNQTNGLLRYAASGTAGNTATAITALSWDTSGNVSTATGNLTVDTAGKTLKIKQGSNACAGTGAVLSSGSVTVNTAAVATGDIILLSCTAASGTQGVPRISSISNGTSFTITSSSGTDASTYSWVIVKAA